MTATVSSTGPASWRRRAGVLVGLVTTLLALWSDPAGAHGGVILTLHGDGHGSVWLTATWSDEHPITDPIGAVLTATSAAGQRIGPAALRRNGDALTYSGTLSAGDWTVVAEMGTPAIGRCQALLHVAEAGSPPTEVRCAPSAAAAPPPSPPPTPSGSSHFIWYVVVAAVGLVAAAGLIAYARRVRCVMRDHGTLPARFGGRCSVIMVERGDRGRLRMPGRACEGVRGAHQRAGTDARVIRRDAGQVVIVLS